MPSKSMIFNETFWKFLTEYENLRHPIELEGLLARLGLTAEEYHGIVSFLEGLGLEVFVTTEGMISPLPKAQKIQFELSFSEWLAMQAHFIEQVGERSKFAEKIVATKIEEVLEDYPHTDLHSLVIETETKKQYIENNYGQHKGLLLTLEECATKRHLCEIVMSDHKVIDLFVHRVVFLDGELCVVGEDCTDRCMVYLEMSAIKGIKKIEELDYVPNFSPVEVNDFIFAIRSISGNEERLVIKIKNQNNVDLTPPYHFLGNPYITSNMEGDLIWAASVEISPELFHWLSSMESNIEILDPAHIREDFEAFCYSAKKLKKAS
jgi:hypothetical protein